MSNKRQPTGKFVTEAQLVEALRVFRREHLAADHSRWWQRLGRRFWAGVEALVMRVAR